MIYHIMKIFAHYGHTDFVLALGYKQEQFKMYFAHFDWINYDVYCELPFVHGLFEAERERWNIHLIDTGEATMKGGRLKRLEKFIADNTFLLAYGDGVANINLRELVDFHGRMGKMVTVTGIHAAPRFGEIHHDGHGIVTEFSEKPDTDSLVNGGFYVMNRRIFDILSEDEWCDLEAGPLELIAQKGEMAVYEHKGFWKCLDTMKDMGELETLAKNQNPPWKVWK
jgi:glucose-1-phosphate cytidylyltransferase